MRVAFVLPSLQNPSGWRTLSLSLVRALRAYVEPVLFVPGEYAPAAHTAFPGLPVIALPVTQQVALANWRGLPRLAASLSRVLRGGFPAVDLVHSLEAYPTGLVGDWLARRLNRPHVLTANGTYGVVWAGQALDRLAYQGVLRRACLVCPISTGTARQMERYFGPALKHTRLWTVLIGNDFYQDVSQEAVSAPRVPQVPTLLSVGDVKPRKGYDLSLAAFAQVKARLPEARYWIVGTYSQNDYYRQLRRFIAEHALQDDVHFLGAISDEALRRCYREASVFILAPRQDGLHFEGFGLVYLEAGAYGMPVVGTRTGGVPDVVLDGVTGLLAEPEDVDGLAAATLRLLCEPELARQLGLANRQRAETLTWERCASEQFQAYQQVLEAA
jgi:glycosyltransferase involved in cell wall biosynthesis